MATDRFENCAIVDATNTTCQSLRMSVTITEVHQMLVCKPHSSVAWRSDAYSVLYYTGEECMKGEKTAVLFQSVVKVENAL